MTSPQLILTNVSLDDLTDQVADKILSRLNNPNGFEKPPVQSKHEEDLLFKSLKEAADYYGVCYQTFSKHLDKITHLPFGRSIKIYKSDIEKAIQKYGILSKKGGNK